MATYAIPQTLDDIPDIPVFPNEEARAEYEKKEITVVDLTLTNDMYKTHLIEQVTSTTLVFDNILSLIFNPIRLKDFKLK